MALNQDSAYGFNLRNAVAKFDQKVKASHVVSLNIGIVLGYLFLTRTQ